MGTSLAQVTRELLESKPYFKYGLEKGVVNYSGLAKLLEKEIEETLGRKVSQEAIAISINRYSEEMEKNVAANEKTMLKLLKSAQIIMKNNIADITYEKGKMKNGAVALHSLSGSKADTVIVNQDDLGKIEVSEALKVRENLVEISIITKPEVEETAGFVHYITSLLAENGINMVEVMSCYTDTILILEENDAVKAYELLKSKTKG